MKEKLLKTSHVSEECKEGGGNVYKYVVVFLSCRHLDLNESCENTSHVYQTKKLRIAVK